ncbi:zinc finger MYM-type protein 1-like isoform X1 [Metopolophium dirhodum]|uniref:zinc finger MYM-type protein 1-like isoform X1 n=1 Tax=Metopolophium dirhodum TaxID=44670 RepID=UPI0029905B33|nr:zinc finger MYM-type protein 1-like isoform X1 [Metopolophium dirhodum]XP_060858776.1 zinc finger MYM-type protein 1-like isoform X1 [Metopolophium dirhodum]XP_060858817.1 zinc finger MYM-type protein 1-like isoform X1 [Metopolophium dirhodum]XP_060858871.1 zinc finger MYM-type protein 1-like isoform X1 [Metopolophium dirhodum]XP_060862402.1 zinc finger MYM-type protein 1-like isoform X1 [Metopolophium dirhodum]XP_060862565.1 zinc finger MYM-type protein 1-like isoform X1 [Metopolophium dir
MSNKRKITSYFDATCCTSKRSVSADEQISKITNIVTENQVVDLVTVDLNVHDIGSYINSTLTDADRYLILKDVWIPPATFPFPLLDCNAKRGLKFKHHWLNAYKWLAYSEKYQGAFCKYCVVFSTNGGIGGQKLGTLVLEAFTNYKKAIEVFKKHANLEYHKTALLKSDNFLNVYLNKSSSIINRIDSERMKQIEENRKRLIPIIECVMLCGQQEIALRGHRDYGPICFSSESNENEGNFRAILKYKAKDIDYMKTYLETGSKNKYISNRTQNEIIETCGDIILKKIVQIVNKSGFFSVLVDETTDVSVKEQLTLCVRYLSGSGENVSMNESFLKFIEVQSLTGENLATVILNGLNACGIDCNNMVGQGYDGASNMSGHLKGVQTIIRETYPKALYVHCVAHSLNLAVSKASNILPIRNCLGVVEKIYCFFNSPKRQNVLLNTIEESDLDPKVKSLKRLCATRWVQRYEAVNDFIELFKFVVVSLETISSWKDTSATDATILIKALDSEFLVSLQVVNILFSYSLPLCKLLQSKGIDLKEAIDLAGDNVTILKNLRSNINTEFNQMFKKAQKMAEFLDFDIKIKRINKRQIYRDNSIIRNDGSTPDSEEYFRVSICVPYIDFFISQLEERFLAHRSIFKGFQCLFSNDFELEGFEELVNFYLSTDIETVKAELNLWKTKLSRIGKSPRTGLDAIKFCRRELFPNVFDLLQIFCTLPVSTATPERMFSCLKRLKTYLRNSMVESRLNGLATMAVHRGVINITSNEVLDELAKKNKKIDLLI